MSEERRTQTFQDLIDQAALEIGDGYRAKNSELGGAGSIFMRAGRLTNNGWDWSEAERFNENLEKKLAGKKSRPGDTVITTKGNSTGRTGYVTKGDESFVYSPHLSYWRSLRASVVDGRYLRYWALSPEFTEQVKSLAHSTDMAPYLSLRDQRRLRITLPEVPEQRDVSSLLGVLDDKIAVNERIAATSSKLADALFGQAVTGLSVGEETFGSVATVAGGGTPSTKVDEYWGGDVPWATPSDVTALPSPYLFGTGRSITRSGLENCASRLYPAQSIFMTSRATIGAFALPQVPTAVNQGFIVVLPPSEDMRWWLLHEMRSRVEEMVRFSNGSTFLELSRKNFKGMKVRLAEPSKVASFAQKVAPLHATAAQVTQENAKLATIRDALLPQLISGRIRVKDAERIVEDHV